MRFPLASTRPAALLLAAGLLMAGCGKAARQSSAGGGGPLRQLAPVERAGAVSVTTRNTTRVGGTSPAVDAAAVARVAYPGLTPGSRPQVVVLVDQRNWPAALAASVLAGAPLHAPILFSEGSSMPAVSLQALEAMHPTGAAALGGAQVIRVASNAPLPAAYRVRTLATGAPAQVAAEIEQLLAAALAPARPRSAVVLSESAPQALQMPLAGLAAESGAPILYGGGAQLPAASREALSSLHRPAIFTSAAEQLATASLGALARLGTVAAIPAGGQNNTTTAQLNSIEVARYTSGGFGWGVKEPGHGLVFADPARPLDAPAAALLSASGEYGPLLLLEGAGAIGQPLSTYLGDLQPAYTSAPEFQAVRGVYNHGWLIGDEQAISLATQAEIDSLLEIAPRKASAGEATVLRSE
ncbi:MAG: hypothetical protein ACYDC2_13480 [Solirubrobacteraceae bacterium]